ncbi:MAG: MFS transporter [Candidatus Obscuribacterales bacterium]|nr:MFS transporter [Candidatus Obscuribacterales bacterium]
MLKRNPAIYIPTLYFAEGLPYAIAMSLSTVYFKSLGASNVFIGLATIISLPWTLKFIWAPFVDFIGTKRVWLLVSQLVLALLMLALLTLALSSGASSSQTINISLGLFMLIALASATHDIAIDGYYLDVLKPQEQAFFVGVRNAAYKVAVLFVSGAMVYLAGIVEKQSTVANGWAAAFAALFLCLLFCYSFHFWYLPKYAEATRAKAPSVDLNADTLPKEDAALIALPQSAQEKLDPKKFLTVILSYFEQRSILAIVFYILTFRLGDALLLRQAQPFLMDPLSKGGMNISIQELGLIYGTVGVIFLLLGGIIGGWLLSRDGVKKWLWPTALFQNCAILIYWWLAVNRPSIPVVYVANAIEQFAYGLGVAAYTVFILSTVKSQYKAAHYAVATALMACGQLVPGMLSGYLYESMGYANFFLTSFLLSIPGMISIAFLPIEQPEKSLEQV